MWKTCILNKMRSLQQLSYYEMDFFVKFGSLIYLYSLKSIIFFLSCFQVLGNEKIIKRESLYIYRLPSRMLS